MSPPAKVFCNSHKKALMVNAIDDLDTADTGKEKISANLPAKFVDNYAVEHEESSHRSSVAVQEKGVEKCDIAAFEDAKGICNDKYELVLVDLQNGSHTPDCLGENKSDHFQSHLQTQTRKRKKNKQTKKRSTLKKPRTSLLSSKLHCCCKHNFTGCCKAAGGGTQTTQTGANKNGVNGGFTAAASPIKNGTIASNHVNRGGGSGDGGEDGDDPRKGKKPIAHDISLKPANSKKQKKKNNTSSVEMEVDDASSSKNSPMDVDPRLDEEQPDKVPMVAVNQDAANELQTVRYKEKPPRPDDKPPRPDDKPPRPDDRPPSQQFLVGWHTRINHAVYCSDNSCVKCQWVNNQMTHYLSKERGGCGCQNCKIWYHVLLFHKGICKISHCHICVNIKTQANIPTAQDVPHDPNIVRKVQTILNVPTSGNSLDSEDTVIYHDDSLQNMTHFREHEDYTFKQQGLVGKGGNGEVYDVVLHHGVKNRYPCLAGEDVVAKKATLREDEKSVFQVIATHPNFVKTYLVVNKTDGDYKNLIFMEKCDMSLQTYMNRLRKYGQVLDRYEAMHYWTQVLDAVVHLHNLRIPVIHKDIKSGNVLLTFRSNLVRAKLADFDAVKILHNEYTQPGLSPRGTKHFIAPEVLGMDVHGRPADIYSMGMFLLELLVRDEIKNPNKKVGVKKLKEIDRDLGELVELCLQKDPSKRPTAIQMRYSHAVMKYSSKDAQAIARERFLNQF